MKAEEKLIKEGYSFHGAYIDEYANEEEKQQFRARRTELKKQGLLIKTVKMQNGTGLYVRRKEE